MRTRPSKSTPRKLTFVRKKDDPTLYIVDVFLRGDDEEPEWGPIDEAWALDPDDFPEDMATEHDGEVVTFDRDSLLAGGGS